MKSDGKHWRTILLLSGCGPTNQKGNQVVMLQWRSGFKFTASPVGRAHFTALRVSQVFLHSNAIPVAEMVTKWAGLMQVDICLKNDFKIGTGKSCLSLLCTSLCFYILRVIIKVWASSSALSSAEELSSFNLISSPAAMQSYKVAS